MKPTFVILHCEILHGRHIDEMVFHVASSLKKAEEYLKNIHMDTHSWWKVLEMITDNPDFHEDAISTNYYTNKGKSLKNVRAKIRRAFKYYDDSLQTLP